MVGKGESSDCGRAPFQPATDCRSVWVRWVVDRHLTCACRRPSVDCLVLVSQERIDGYLHG